MEWNRGSTGHRGAEDLERFLLWSGREREKGQILLSPLSPKFLSNLLIDLKLFFLNLSLSRRISLKQVFFRLFPCRGYIREHLLEPL